MIEFSSHTTAFGDIVVQADIKFSRASFIRKETIDMSQYDVEGQVKRMLVSQLETQISIWLKEQRDSR